MIAAIVVAMLLATPGAVTDGTCTDSTEPQVAALGDLVDEALAKTPVVYRDGGDAGGLSQQEKNRRTLAIKGATGVRGVPALQKQIGEGRCAALALAAVMASFPGRQTNLEEVVDYAVKKGWTMVGALTGQQMVDVSEHFGYSATTSGGLPSYESIAKATSGNQPLLVGVSGNRSKDPTLSVYSGHMLVVTGIYETEGIRYVVGKDPNYPGDVAWRYDDLASATNETITVRPR